MADVGQKVKRLREQRGWSQAELARRSGVSQAGISYIESGDKAPSLTTLEKLASGLGVPMIELLDDSVPPIAESA